MNFQHKELSQGKWQKLSLIEQMANIGSEVERAINWKNRNNEKYSQMAFERALELIDLTMADKKNRHRLDEIARVRESLADYFIGKNQYSSSDKIWRNYFHSFGLAAAIKSGL
jgi:hypothetical protein